MSPRSSRANSSKLVWAGVLALSLVVIVGAAWWLVRGGGNSSASSTQTTVTPVSTPAVVATPRPGVPATAGPAPTPAPTGEASATPAPAESADTVQVVYQRTGTPADGVTVTLRPRGAQEPRVFVTDAEGRFPRPQETASVEVFDPRTELLLIQVPALPDRGVPLRVWEPMRLKGRLLGTDAKSGTPTLMIGHGRRVTAADRLRRETGSQVRPDPAENTPYGPPLPLTSPFWLQTVVDARGEFLSPWFLAIEPPQVIANDAAGRFVAADAELPDGMRPHAEIDVGDLVLAPGATLEVELQLPEGEVGAAIGLSVEWARLPASQQQRGALMMSVLDRLDPRLGNFVRRKGEYYLTKAGVTTLAPLPPFEELALIARGVTPDKIARRSVSLKSGEVTRVSFTADELFPAVTDTARVEGIVKLEGTDTRIAGATIVASWRRAKVEAITDENGAYSLEGVPRDQELTLFLEALDEQDPARYSHTETRRLPGLPPSEPVAIVNWDVPSFRWLTVEGSASELAGGPDGPVVSLETRSAPGAPWEPFPDVLDFYFEDGKIDIEIRRAGTFRALVQQGPFLVRYSQSATFGANDFAATVGLEPDTGAQGQVSILVQLPDGRPAGNATAYLTAPFPGSPTLEVTANPMGLVSFGPVNIGSADLRIEDARGCYEGLVSLQRAFDTVVQLTPCE